MYYNMNNISWIKIRIWFQLQNMIHAVTTSGATPKSRVKYSTNFAKRARLRGPTSQKIRFKCRLHLKHWLNYSQFSGRFIFNWGCPKKFQAWKKFSWLFGWDNKTLCIWFQNLVLGGIGIFANSGTQAKPVSFSIFCERKLTRCKGDSGRSCLHLGHWLECGWVSHLLQDPRRAGRFCLDFKVWSCLEFLVGVLWILNCFLIIRFGFCCLAGFGVSHFTSSFKNHKKQVGLVFGFGCVLNGVLRICFLIICFF